MNLRPFPPSPPGRRTFPRAAAAVVALAGALTVARAQSNGAAADPLKQLSIDELMDVDVTSVSKTPEPLLDAPAAIQLITSEDIEHSAAASLPQALRLADNLEVDQKDATEWAISARGFNANLGDKLLVLIDGRTVYSPLYAGVLWNVQDYPLADIDRIEVISGPGGTLWGANAMNGVINITTKSAKDTPGLYAEEALGDQLRDQTEVRYGGTAAPGVYYRVYAEHTQDQGDVFGDGASAGDLLRMTRAGFRIDSDASPSNLLTLQGDFYGGAQEVSGAGYGSLNGGNVLGRWTHTTAGGSDVTVQAYYDRTHLAQPADAVPADPPYESGFPASALVDNLGTYDVDLQSHFRLGEQQRLVWGLGYRYTHEVDFDLGIIQFVPGTLDQSLYSAFVQDDIALTPTMAITAGSKLEHNSYTGVEVEPSGRWQWNFDPKQMLWVAVSRAVRAPSRYDRDLEVLTGLENPPYPYRFPRTFLAGDPDFVSETLVAYELGYRAVLAQRLSGSVSTFYNDYDSLRGTAAAVPTATAPFPYPVTFDNDLAGDTYGAEFTLSYQALDWWRLHAGYDLLLENLYSKPGHPDATGALNETADPKHQVFLRSTAELPRGLELDAALRWISALTLDSSPTNGPVAGTVPSYWELDAHLAWQATRNLELSLVGQNLLHRDHAEYGFPGPTREEIPRDFYVRAELRY